MSVWMLQLDLDQSTGVETALPPSYFLFSLPLRPPSAVSHQADKAQRALGVR